MNKRQGFTLTEILVALVILCSSFLALVEISGKHTSNAIHIRDKTFAHWVAMNKLTETRISGKFPNIGTTDGTETMAEREWFWQQEVKETEIQSIRRVTVTVKADKNQENPLINRVGFVRKPAKKKKK